MDKQSLEKEQDNATKSQNIPKVLTTQTSKHKRVLQPTIKYARIKSSFLASSKTSKATKVSLQLSENCEFDTLF